MYLKIIRYSSVALLLSGLLVILGYSPVQAIILSSELTCVGIILKISTRNLHTFSLYAILTWLACVAGAYCLLLFTHSIMFECYGFTLEGGNDILTNPLFVITVLLLICIEFRKSPDTVSFISNRKTVTLPINDILYIESNDRTVDIVTVKGERYTCYTGIEKWDRKLGKRCVRTHRSYLVNMSHISGACEDSVTMKDIGGNLITLPISRKYRHLFSDNHRQKFRYKTDKQ